MININRWTNRIVIFFKVWSIDWLVGFVFFVKNFIKSFFFLQNRFLVNSVFCLHYHINNVHYINLFSQMIMMNMCTIRKNNVFRKKFICWFPYTHHPSTHPRLFFWVKQVQICCVIKVHIQLTLPLMDFLVVRSFKKRKSGQRILC